jgi:hypothetical protein
MRRQVATAAGREEAPDVLRAEKGTRDEALSLIFAPTERREGFRHGALGAPGYGKTYHMREVVRVALDRGLVDLVLTHDTKGREAEFHGTQLRTVDDAATAEELDRTRHAVFRGDPRAAIACDPQTVGDLALKLARSESPQRVLTNINELDTCLTDGGRGWNAPAIREIITQGRALELSQTWTTQQPQRVPNEPLDQSTTIAFFHLDRRAVNYLGNTLLLDEEMVALLPTLERGDFVLWVPGSDWNRKVYRF